MSVKPYLRLAKDGKSNICADFTINGTQKRQKTGRFLCDKPKTKNEKDYNKATKKIKKYILINFFIKIKIMNWV